MKYVIGLTWLVCCLLPASASEMEGYIIRQNSDTVRGKVDVVMRRVSIGRKELDLWAMEQEIRFAENGNNYRDISAGDISGYGFNDGDIWYHFVVLDWERNTWKKAQGVFGRKTAKLKVFLHRAFDGALPYYRDYYKMESNMMGSAGTRQELRNVTDLYIMSNDLGYVQVVAPGLGATKRLKEFFMKYLTLEEAFLDTVDEKAKFSDAEEIIKSYHEWKKRNGS